jgi:hypothetical protein
MELVGRGHSCDPDQRCVRHLYDGFGILATLAELMLLMHENQVSIPRLVHLSGPLPFSSVSKVPGIESEGGKKTQSSAGTVTAQSHTESLGP